MVGVIIKDPRKPRRKVSNAGDARDLVQESRERRDMTDREYLGRMNEICRDTPGEKGRELRKARLLDMEHRKERGI